MRAHVRRGPSVHGSSVAHPGPNKVRTLSEQASAWGILARMDANSTQTAAFIIGTLATVVAVRVGLRRTLPGDLFHPLVFPTLYVSVACLGPAAWLYFRNDSLGYINSSQLGTRYPVLMTVAVLGFIFGSAIRFQPPKNFQRHQGRGLAVDSRTLITVGRIAILLPLAMAVLDLSNGLVLTRGQDQATYTVSDSIGVAAFLLTPAALTLILVGRTKLERRSLLSLWDWTVVATLVTALALSGRRGAALSAFLLILMLMAYRKKAKLRIVIGLGAVLAFAHSVVQYRIEAVGGTVKLSPAEVLLRDLGSVVFTTGTTDSILSESDDYRHGASLLAAAIRLIPSPVAIRLIGPPSNTGALQFRDLLSGTRADQGYGYSIPAEGVLNFGVLGLFTLCLGCGALLAWLYARFDLTGNHAINWIYLTAIATLPFAWRSDALGAVKGVLYPLVIMAVVATVARASMQRDAPSTPLAWQR
ncbi:O-antigen polysaccharide polymerase Wzy [Janibacter cremeus]|uniref:Oligosaccharide repeat unit polymerase n=1 Tax=Janibacter cremeus TaxID=1285192 RepID=A0A852VRR5_9MICO|nr:hypothetical protein [Janibacter cremeus]